MSSDARGRCHLEASRPQSSSDELAWAVTQMAALTLTAEHEGALTSSTVIDQAASHIGIHRDIVATWAADGSVTATSTRIKPSQCVEPGTTAIAPDALLALPCRHGGVQKKRRTLLYARTDLDAEVTETAQMHVLEAEIEKILAVTPHDCSEPYASYMYTIEIAAQDDYDRPGVDTLLALVAAQQIDRIVVWRVDRLFSPGALALFTCLCKMHNVSIVSVARD